MSAPMPTVCPVCLGQQEVLVSTDGHREKWGPCPGCSCAICGEPTTTPPECLDCFCREDSAARRRVDR